MSLNSPSTLTEVDSRFVKRGLWVNQSQGSVMGKTITTDTRTGAIVIAILTIVASIGKRSSYVMDSF
jgi:hypothetical protein